MAEKDKPRPEISIGRGYTLSEAVRRLTLLKKDCPECGRWALPEARECLGCGHSFSARQE